FGRGWWGGAFGSVLCREENMLAWTDPKTPLDTGRLSDQAKCAVRVIGERSMAGDCRQAVTRRSVAQARVEGRLGGVVPGSIFSSRAGTTPQRRPCHLRNARTAGTKQADEHEHRA